MANAAALQFGFNAGIGGAFNGGINGGLQFGGGANGCPAAQGANGCGAQVGGPQQGWGGPQVGGPQGWGGPQGGSPFGQDGGGPQMELMSLLNQLMQVLEQMGGGQQQQGFNPCQPDPCQQPPQQNCCCGQQQPQNCGPLQGTPDVTAGDNSDTINLGNGQQITENGDPHEGGIDGGEATWTSKDRQLVLPNGNVVSMTASAANGEIDPNQTKEYGSLQAAEAAGMPTDNLGFVSQGQDGKFHIQNANQGQAAA
jgi:hypothetical protein